MVCGDLAPSEVIHWAPSRNNVKSSSEIKAIPIPSLSLPADGAEHYETVPSDAAEAIPAAAETLQGHEESKTRPLTTPPPLRLSIALKLRGVPITPGD